ncbi:hypothetical protein Aab01nite_83340 [Paractinoplanes abujensis]|uniref:Uncharacterized protein n=1 Tax=Paractinoplanes abujensis TaxID=882441 RepID=A0A7W7CVV7_9ACTN|nr:hypothetical protein [Actinoplanes abujensis]MBB4695389.1 hypothetical protein [Actinoplanes abujensis]GID24744.1 hypothetical protein Aab01nite_83340 [Actinoplanes abujensis]
MSATPDDLERKHTLSTATTRYDELRMRDALAAVAGPGKGNAVPLTREETLEMLALGEVVIRKAGYARQSMVRVAREAGASWAQIGAALGTTKQAAWEAHRRSD